MTKKLLWFALFMMVCAAGALVAINCSKSKERLPNILIITCDTLRADRLHLYGHNRETSPQLDKLAKESVVFERFYANSSFTPPSHASILTGKYVKTHGVLWWNDTLSHGTPTIAQLVGTPKERKANEDARGLGYRTGAFVNLNNFTQLEVTRGFDHIRSEMWLPGDELNKDFLGWVDDTNDQRQFCAWLHYWDPHRPYAFRSWIWLDPKKTPEQLNAMKPADRALTEKMARTSRRPDYIFNETLFGKGDLGVGRDDGHYNRKKEKRSLPSYIPASGGPRILTSDDDRFLIDRYDGGVAFQDEQLGKLIEGLRSRGVLDNTILVITSDHGETFTERDDEYFTHDPHLYDEVAHIPCIIRFPNGKFGGTRIAAVSESVDIVPTIYDYLGLLTDPSKFAGESLMTVLDKKSRTKQIVFAQTQDKTEIEETKADGKVVKKFVVTNKKYSARSAKHRLIAIPTKPDWTFEFYDMVADPGAKKNLHTKPAGPDEEILQQALFEWVKSTPAASDAGREMSPAELDSIPEGYIKKKK
ncbi:MAG: sulfatase [Planctomycetota bacterium]